MAKLKKEEQQEPQEPEISDKVVLKGFPKAPADLYGRLTLVEGMNYLSDLVPSGEPEGICERWSRKVAGHYNKALNVSLVVREDPEVDDFGVRDGLLLVEPGRRGGLRNEDFVLMHECAHDKQRMLLGFRTRAEMVDSFSDDLTASELGARDWVEKYTMPPFTMSDEDRETVLKYYGGREARKSLAMGLRDIHSDVLALRSRGSIYLTPSEVEEGVKPEEKFMRQFKDELAANAAALEETDFVFLRRLDELGVRDNIRKAARFAAVAGGASRVFEDAGYLGIVSRFHAGMRRAFKGDSGEYATFSALTRAYKIYFTNCMQRTDLIETAQIIPLLGAPNPALRARAADFLGETKSMAALGVLGRRLEVEPDPYVKNTIDHAIDALMPNDLGDERTWACLSENKGNKTVVSRILTRLFWSKDMKLPGNSEAALSELADTELRVQTELSSEKEAVEVIAEAVKKVSAFNPGMALRLAERISKHPSAKAKSWLFPELEWAFDEDPKKALDITERITRDLDCMLAPMEHPMYRERNERVLEKVSALMGSHGEQPMRILDNVRRNRNKEVGLMAVHCLARMSSRPECLASFVAGFGDLDPRIVGDTLEGAAALLRASPATMEAVVPAISGIEESRSPLVKASAAKALGALCEADEAHIPRLRKLLHDPDPKVSGVAVKSMVGVFCKTPASHDDLMGVAASDLKRRKVLASALKESDGLRPDAAEVYFAIVDPATLKDDGNPNSESSSDKRSIESYVGRGLGELLIKHPSAVHCR